MDLHFMCPLTGKSYLSRNWQIVGELNVQQDLRGNKTLRGTVEVRCPHCEETHAYPTEELVCPMSQTGNGVDQPRRLKVARTKNLFAS
ncbi:MAG TPA: hypothetical protein DEO88_14240, partial [Syntrophobacteraceae bacterium]|nr:hypothetical protein [Syntrophobacteraceae bacterium]